VHKLFASNLKTHLAAAARLCRVAMCIVFGIVPVIALAQAGSLDTTFATNGIFSSSFSGATNLATTVTVLSSGQILVGGQVSTNGGVIRLNSNGTLDTTFGKSGLVSLTFADVAGEVTGMAVLSDGKILVLGNGLPQGGDIYRLNANGSIDTTFGSNGSVFLANTPGLLALLSNGEFLVTSTPAGTTNSVAQRYEANGQLDTTFGTNGTAPVVAGSAMIVLSNGHFVITGAGFTGSGSVIEYDANGSLDTNFGILGQAATLDGSAIALQSNGEIVTVGAVTSQLALSGNSQGFGVMRFLTNGTADNSFGTRGGVMTTFPEAPTTAANAVVIQTNGDLVVGGEAGTSGVFGSDLTESFALARYLSTGALDTTFGTNGLVTTSLGSPDQAAIFALALQSDGKILAVGANGPPGGNSALVVARYLGQ
jgi:uncharacterized delta-60 repeat protein